MAPHWGGGKARPLDVKPAQTDQPGRPMDFELLFLAVLIVTIIILSRH